MKKRKFIKNKSIIIFSSLFLFFLSLALVITNPRKTKSANLISVTATLSNPRLSYRGGVSGTPSAGATSVDIDTSGNADNNTNHLFIKDTVCFAPSSFSGCKGNTTYTVNSIIDTDTFTFTPGLAGALAADDYVIATQSSTLTISFTTVSEIPANGNILVTIPAIKVTGQTCDGFPDTTTLANNGFDLKNVAAAQVSVTGCTDANWNATETITCGNGSNDHTILINRQTASCAAGSTITITIQNVINPAPSTGHTQGTADIYNINIKTRDGSNYTLDESDAKIAPVEGVFVSATVDETLSFTVAGITADSGSYCGVTRTSSSPDTTATSIPWGIVSPTYAAATHNTAQQLTVSTNANNGYKVYIEESDQMGRNGNVCTGTAPSSGEFTFGSSICIRDTVCAATPCSHTTSQDWTNMSTYVGLGYSLQNATGSDAKFLYNESSRTFSAKQLADVQGGENRADTNAEIMTNSGPVNGSSVYVCYRIAIPATQPAGYYYNTVKYTAVPTF